MIKNHLPRKTFTVAVLTAASLIAAATITPAQQPAAPAPSTAPAVEEAFASEIGQASVDRGAAANSNYTIAATTDYASKQTGAKIRLMVVEKENGGTMTHLLTINTGKYKTVSQLTGTLAEIFRKYLAIEPANQEIGKIGDVSHGGEIRFYAESRESLRYDWLTLGEPAHSTKFSRNDIQAFLGILAHPKAGN